MKSKKVWMAVALIVIVFGVALMTGEKMPVEEVQQ